MINQQILENSKLQQYLDEKELNNLFQYCTVLDFKPDEKIIEQGKIGEGLYYILNGSTIATAKIMASGYTTLEKRNAGEFFDEISFMEKVPSPKSFIACSHVQCLFIPHLYMDLLAQLHPKTKFKLFCALINQVYNRLKLINDKIATILDQSDMTTMSHFSNIIHSLTKPTVTTLDEVKLDINLLYRLPLFEQMTTNEIDNIIKQINVITAPKNCTIIGKAEKSPSCYIPIHGAVQSSIVHDNKTAKLSVIGPGTLFANIACIEANLTFDITFVTCEKSVLLKFSDEAINFIKNKHPMMWYKLFYTICRSLVALERSVDKLEIRLNTEIYNR